MSEQYFILNDDEDSYKRNIDPVNHYVEQVSYYINKQTNIPIERCRELIKKAIQDREAFPMIQNPKVLHYQRQRNGDKQIVERSLTEYIKDVITNKEILAPSFTSYMHPDVKESMISKFTMSNVTLRSKVKKMMFVEKTKGNLEKAQSYDLAQKNYKQYNNALSGALVSNGSVVRNPSGHSSLTSTTRTVTSLGNASNERLIMGNRHYRSPLICLYNIISICSTTNKELVAKAMKELDLKYPTVEDALACINRSSRFYWVDRKWENRLKIFLSKLDKEELASFVYTGDLYHLRLLNEDKIRVFIDELTRIVESDLTHDQLKEQIKSYDETTTILSRLINYDDLCGNKTPNIQDLNEPILRKLVGTCQHIEEVLLSYKPLIDAFLTTINLPPSIAYIADMVRKTVVLSDTDSTCASYGEWVEWRYGKTGIKTEGIAFSAGVMTLGTQTIRHNLAVLSSNIGVTKSNLRRLGMKNEFLWSIFCPANISKTYFASTIVQEGVIFPKYDLEYKGVQYKSANSPKPVNDLIKEIMNYVITSICSTGKYSLNHILLQIYNLEKQIYDYIHTTDPRALDYFPQLNIKEATSYALQPHRSNYFHYLLWQEVFQPKYGEINPPPFRTIKIPLDIANKTDLKNWIDNIQDRPLANRLATFLTKLNKTDIKLICLPIEYVKNNGIPVEIREVLSLDRLLNNVLGGLYLLVESLGFTRVSSQTFISSVLR